MTPTFVSKSGLFLNDSTASKWPIIHKYMSAPFHLTDTSTIYYVFHVAHCWLRVPSSSSASVCFAVCLLSLAWALVLYARACSLIRPGHLQMTPAAILCRLVWRVGTFLPFTRKCKLHLPRNDAFLWFDRWLCFLSP